jgi:uncharacterized protein
VTVRTLADLAAIAGCTTIGGDLVIEGAEVSALDALGGLLSVVGDLVFRDTVLTVSDLAALASLVAVGGDVVLVGSNPSLPPCEVEDAFDDRSISVHVVDGQGSRLDSGCE